LVAAEGCGKALGDIWSFAGFSYIGAMARIINAQR
jgi:hypothetical protein